MFCQVEQHQFQNQDSEEDSWWLVPVQTLLLYPETKTKKRVKMVVWNNFWVLVPHFFEEKNPLSIVVLQLNGLNTLFLFVTTFWPEYLNSESNYVFSQVSSFFTEYFANQAQMVKVLSK